MAARVLLGIVAALRAVLIPGEAALMCSEPLRRPRLRVLPARPVAGDPAGAPAKP